MTAAILEILQQRVRTLNKKLAQAQAKLRHVTVQIQECDQAMLQAQQHGNVQQVRQCLMNKKQLQEQIPSLQHSVANIEKSLRLFERQLQQNLEIQQ